ncbi:MAG TPA: periplasmic heavy metal sensor [Candidatus Aminicenantes bacterium]|nr:periplasmic heavy metal sensor [Candidatus Aminicenantes bacterium]HRY64378.1 periplasmic heavy metal sensor [Candidatus Aminicenantes bacterium]HRZ71291.1 periplasmic heavy metal sensor [Candidatus Aminicenantes bacterium]
MNRKLGRMSLLVLVVINVSALLTFAYNRWVREPGRRPAPAPSLMRELCLSGPQKKCIEDFRCAFDAETRGILARIQEKRVALVEEMKKTAPDEAVIVRLIEEIGGLQAEIQKKAVANLLKEKEVLTDEQKAKFFRLFQDHVCPREEGADGAAAARRGGCPQDQSHQSLYGRNTI